LIGLAGGINTYAYLSGNPLSDTDPMGLAGGNYRPPPPGPQYDLRYPPIGDKYKNTYFYKDRKCNRGPDFVNFQIDGYIFSVWGTFTRDGNSFVGGGLNATLPNQLNLSASASAGWLNKSTVLPGETANFAGGYSGGGAAAYVGIGGGVVYSPGNGTATVVGIGAGKSLGAGFNSGATFSGGYSKDMGDSGIGWGDAEPCTCSK
jgi:uncharacterized protein RhaS with RHS repeats